MEVLDVVTAVIIALYAMIGGALINATLTAPHNVRRLLRNLDGRKAERIHKFVTYGGGFMIIALSSLMEAGSKFALNIYLCLGIVHLTFFILLATCRQIANSIVE